MNPFLLALLVFNSALRTQHSALSTNLTPPVSPIR